MRVLQWFEHERPPAALAARRGREGFGPNLLLKRVDAAPHAHSAPRLVSRQFHKMEAAPSWSSAIPLRASPSETPLS